MKEANGHAATDMFQQRNNDSINNSEVSMKPK